jgi:protein-S-isoprenylcysteine O-methyltransferase Ste14
MNPNEAVKWIWIAFGVFWLLAAFAQKRTIRRQSISSRLFQIAIVLLAVLPYFVSGHSEIVRQRFLPNTLEIRTIGALIVLAGCGFAVWARFVLGTNWSGTVTVKENHELITRGPYAWVRHPIYTGVLLALLGNAVVAGRIAALLAVGAVMLAFWLKLRIEERFMMETFGQQYVTYKRHVKALIPYLI